MYVVLSVSSTVQYPSLRDDFHTDMQTFRFILSVASYFFTRLSLRPLYDELYVSLGKELDFTIEADNARRCALNFGDKSNVYIPKVHYDYTSKVRHTAHHEYAVLYSVVYVLLHMSVYSE